MDPQRQPFVVLIGGSGWATELTAAEALQLQSAVALLLQQLEAIAPMLMPQESIELEHSSQGLWLQLRGWPECWSLRLVLDHPPADGAAGRGFEAEWDAAASAPLAAALLALGLPG